jgi:hypothetical protein
MGHGEIGAGLNKSKQRKRRESIISCFSANYRKLPQFSAILVQFSATPVQFFALQVQLSAIPVRVGAIAWRPGRSKVQNGVMSEPRHLGCYDSWRCRTPGTDGAVFGSSLFSVE